MHAALLALSLALSAPALASPKSDLTSGMVAFETQDYARAAAYFQDALRGGLRARDVPKAHYYRARALLNDYVQSQGGRDPKPPAVVQQAMQALLDARRADQDGRWEEQLDEVRGQVVVVALSVVSEQVYITRQLPDAQAMAQLTVELAPDNPMAHYLLGMAFEQLGQKVEARQAFGRVVSLVEQAPPEPPNLMLVYAAFWAAVYERHVANDPAAALAVLDRGDALLARDWARISEPDDGQQRDYHHVQREMDNLRLDTMLSVPELRPQAIALLEGAIRDDPDSYVKTAAYAQAIESIDPEKAIQLYERAIEIDGERVFAHFNLGAFYVNRAAAINMRANELDDFAEAGAMMSEAAAEMLRAKPHLERALAIEPDNLEAIRALMTIAIQEDDTEAYGRLKDERDRLEGR